jgi:hypothetical protein
MQRMLSTEHCCDNIFLRELTVVVGFAFIFVFVISRSIKSLADLLFECLKLTMPLDEISPRKCTGGY